MNLTVFYNGQFWVGVIERTTAEGLFAGQHLFGAEPKDEEVFEFVLKDLGRIIDSQTIAVAVNQKPEKRINPKRLARQAAREVENVNTSSKSQAAIQAQFEANKKEKLIIKKDRKLEEQEQKRQIKQEKAKQRHRGR